MDEKRLSAHEKSLAELSGKVLSLDARTQENEERVKALEEVASRNIISSPYRYDKQGFSLVGDQYLVP